MPEIKEAKVDLSSLPEVSCPHCGAKFHGWALKARLSQVIDCDECHGQMKLI